DPAARGSAGEGDPGGRRRRRRGLGGLTAWCRAQEGGGEKGSVQEGERGRGGGLPRVAVSASPLVVVHRDVDLLTASVAARLVTRLVDAQASRGTAHVVLTGGTVGIGVLAALAGSAAR